MNAATFAQLRATLGYSEARFARCLGVKQATISRWEHGTRRVPEMAARLALIAVHMPQVRKWMEEELGRKKDAHTP